MVNLEDFSHLGSFKFMKNTPNVQGVKIRSLVKKNYYEFYKRFDSIVGVCLRPEEFMVNE